MSGVPKSILRLPLEKRAEIAFKEAVEGVIDEHAAESIDDSVRWEIDKRT